MTEKIPLPEDFKDKEWAKAIVDEEGNIDLTKTLNKLSGQESLLGKRHIPGKNATDEELREFNKKRIEDYEDSEYEGVLSGLETKSEAIAKLKEAGYTPKQAKVLAEINALEKSKTIEKRYDAETFQSELLKTIPNEKDRAKGKAVLMKAGLWDSTVEASNDEAIRNIVAASKIGVAYDVDDVPGKTGGESNLVQSNGKGYGQEYVNRCFELAKTMTHAQAVAQAKAEYGVVDEGE